MRDLFRFPDPVNEVSARFVALGVVVEGLVFVTFREWWLLIPLVYGFAARVATGPTLSPLGQLVTRVITPASGLAEKPVPGKPKRFAQAIGFVFSSGAATAWAIGAISVSVALIGALVAAASLEAFAGVCLGCIIYRRVWGCEDCEDVSDRLRRATAVSPSSPQHPVESDEVAVGQLAAR